jgi:signal transduction histidine kinase
MSAHVGQLSVKFKLALGVSLPLLLVLSLLSWLHYSREQRLVADQQRFVASQLGQALEMRFHYGLRQNNDLRILGNVMNSVASMPQVQAAALVGESGTRLAVSAEGALADWHPEQHCEACHTGGQPQTESVLSLPQPGGWRVVRPLVNREECRACHQPQEAHPGFFVLDVNLGQWEQHLQQALRADLFFSLLAALAVSVGSYLFGSLSILRRLAVVPAVLHRWGSGDFSARLHDKTIFRDEFSELLEIGNRMAAELQAREVQQRSLQQAREQAILEERERIARDLHDSLAQMLAFLRHKIAAAGISLQQDTAGEAGRILDELEGGLARVSQELRETILGLRLSGQVEDGLRAALEQFVHEFALLTDCDLRFEAEGALDDLQLPLEVELHLFRIAQEALSNVRRHADARQAWVRLHRTEQDLLLEIGDDGRGFDLLETLQQPLSFGLRNMRERCAEIGAHLDIVTAPGKGTRVCVRLPLKEEKHG